MYYFGRDNMSICNMIISVEIYIRLNGLKLWEHVKYIRSYNYFNHFFDQFETLIKSETVNPLYNEVAFFILHSFIHKTSLEYTQAGVYGKCVL